MLTIGLTGGIGSGKSTTTDLFRELDVPVIDTDAIAHHLVEPGQALLEPVFQQFGRDLQRDDGSLNRDLLRERVFADETLRKQLESLMHPAIREEIMKQLDAIKADYCIIAVPLLVETGHTTDYDRILVVDCSEATQQRRVLQRQGLTNSQFQAIIKSQCTRQQRLSKADDIIYNDSDDVAVLKKQVLILHQQYLDLSKNA